MRGEVFEGAKCDCRIAFFGKRKSERPKRVIGQPVGLESCKVTVTVAVAASKLVGVQKKNTLPQSRAR